MKAVLENPGSTLTQLTQAITQLEKKPHARTVKMGVSSAVTMNLLGTYLRKHGLLNDTAIEIVPGNFDDPIGDVERFIQAGVTAMVLWPFFDTLMPAFEAQVPRLSTDTLDAKEAELRQRYRLAFARAQPLNTVYLGTFHRMASPSHPAAQDAVAQVITRFNRALREEAAAFHNVRLIDADDIIRTLGATASFDSRFYYRSKAPYTAPFMDALATRIANTSRGFGAHYYKVLVLDCDNTLWGGIVGEDLIHGIKLDPYDYPGNIFWRVQHEFAALSEAGVVICLCSKNNPADVDEVLREHPQQVLRDQHIIIKQVNWADKPSNLRSIAQSLNVGLDSLVFVDDSAFEIAAVAQQLPMVKTVQVPKALNDYPQVVARLKTLFLASGTAEESQHKTAQYQQRAQAEAAKADFDSHDAYLASLAMAVNLYCNQTAHIARISELSQKSNQFNLTTTRYSESEIAQRMADPAYRVYSLAVSDKFGEAGITGVAVIYHEGKTAIVENVFMSCRVIGRGVEFCFWPHILEHAQTRGCTHIEARYAPSAKNAQVADFYDRLGLRCMEQTADGVRHYAAVTNVVPLPLTPWITINHAEC